MTYANLKVYYASSGFCISFFNPNLKIGHLEIENLSNIWISISKMMNDYDGVALTVTQFGGFKSLCKDLFRIHSQTTPISFTCSVEHWRAVIVLRRKVLR